MFHISTMLPYSKENKQQVSRFTSICYSFCLIYWSDKSFHNRKGRCGKSRDQLKL